MKEFAFHGDPDSFGETIPVPVVETCLHCDEPIEESDNGVVTPLITLQLVGIEAPPPLDRLEALLPREATDAAQIAEPVEARQDEWLEWLHTTPLLKTLTRRWRQLLPPESL